MATTWYLAHIRYQRENEAGTLSTVNEHHLIDAVSYTEGEARTLEVVASNTPDFQLVKLTKMRLTDVFNEPNGSEKWFKAKVVYSSFNEKTQKEKKTPHFMLLNTENPKEAYEFLKNELGNLNDYEITDIILTPILEVHPYEPVNELLKNGNFKPLNS